MPGMGPPAFNPITWEVRGWRTRNSKLAWSTWDPASKKNKNKTEDVGQWVEWVFSMHARGFAPQRGLGPTQ